MDILDTSFGEIPLVLEKEGNVLAEVRESNTYKLQFNKAFTKYTRAKSKGLPVTLPVRRTPSPSRSSTPQSPTPRSPTSWSPTPERDELDKDSQLASRPLKRPRIGSASSKTGKKSDTLRVPSQPLHRQTSSHVPSNSSHHRRSPHVEQAESSQAPHQAEQSTLSRGKLEDSLSGLKSLLNIPVESDWSHLTFQQLAYQVQYFQSVVNKKFGFDD